MSTLSPYVLFAIQTVLLFFLSRAMILQLFYLLEGMTRNRDFVFSVLAAVFLPGTIVHEMSHFLAAMVLLLPVGEIRIMPEWKKNHIQFGRVTYGKKDIIRSILVGIAPFFGALGFFWFLGAFRLFPSEHLFMTILLGYLVFAVSANMFSSKQDLVDLIYIIPLAGVLWGFVYVTGIRFAIPPAFVSSVSILLQTVNFYITISLGLHIGALILFRSLRLILKK